MRSQERVCGLCRTASASAARDHTLQRQLAVAAGVAFLLAVSLSLSSCDSPTRATGGGGGGTLSPPPGWTPVSVGEPFQGTIKGTDALCTDPSDYYNPGVPCQRFALLLPGRAGVLTVQLAWDDSADQLQLSAPASWSECCSSPLTHQIAVAAASPYVLAFVKFIGPKDSGGSVASTLSQKFTLTTSFSPQ
jgi:hypothetical protein